MRVCLVNLVALVLGLYAAVSSGHESRPTYVEISEREANLFSVMWKVPVTVAASNVPEVILPDGCIPSGPATGRNAVRNQLYRCDSDLSGAAITLHYPRFNPSVSALIRLERRSGETHQAVLSPDESVWRVPQSEQTLTIAKEYMALGVKHILEGYDHLLFVACLVLIAGTLRRILVTVTGFTVAHSVTLALAALGLVQVPVPPVEASIALSIVFLATELARERRDTLTWRYPIAVSASFGLLHGFGFASVLGEIGLPQTEIPAALLFFNIGVEVGQIVFVLTVLALFVLVRHIAAGKLSGRRPLSPTGTALLRRPAGYVVGTLAALWMVERVVSFWA